MIKNSEKVIERLFEPLYKAVYKLVIDLIINNHEHPLSYEGFLLFSLPR